MNKVYVKLFIFVGMLMTVSVGYFILHGEERQARSASQEIIPVDPAEPVSILTRKRKNTYYRLDSGREMAVTVTGPVRLRTITRFDFSADGPRAASYEIRRVRDDGEPELFKIKGRPSYVSRYEKEKDRRVGKIRNLWTEIPEGEHTVYFGLPAKAPYRVNFRFLVKVKKRQARSWAYLDPDEAPDELSVAVKGKKRKYFPVTTEEKLVLRVEGPAEVRLMTRWTNPEPSSAGHYVVKVLRDGVPKILQPFEAPAAPDARVAGKRQSKVGQRRLVFITVPKELHRYEITAEDVTGAEQILIRPFILHSGEKAAAGE